LHERRIIAAMVGRNIEQEYPKRATCVQSEVVMSVRSLSSPGKFEDVSFDLHKGEVLGFAGLVGSGRTEIARAIFGADPPGSGEIWINSKPYIRPSPLKSIKQHIAFLTENPKEEDSFCGIRL
jgi:ribose transport system ATP-binding protein